MQSPFKISNTLHRDGNSQAQRELDARKPSAAPADGRDVLDILSFLNDFAKQVNFYDKEEGVGDWTPFFQNSVPFRLAAIAQFDAEKWWDTFQKNREKGDVQAIMGQLFYAFVQHQQWHIGLHPPKLFLNESTTQQEWRTGSEEDKNPVRIVLKNLTDTNMKFLLLEYIGVFNTLKDKFQSPFMQNLDVFFSKEATDRVWHFELDSIRQTDAVLQSKLGNKTTILPTLLPRLDRIAELVYKAQRAIGEVFIKESPDTLIFDNEEHEPHLGLLFAFLRLYKFAQGDMNALTQRQLEYFYKNVLLFQEKAAIPDKAHLVFELAKHIQGVHIVKRDTAFKDGKDKNKAEIIFATDKETALNKAKVAELRTLLVENNVPYVFKQEGGDAGESFASFGENDQKKNGFDSKSAKGRVGFILASSVLRMREGTRKVTISLTFDTPLSILDLNTWKNILKIEYTTKDKWEAVNTLSILSISKDNKTLSLEFTLAKTDKPVEPLEDKTLNPYGIVEPMIKILLNETHADFLAVYNLLKSAVLVSKTIEIDVKEVRSHLKLQNGDGIVDGTKPFQPFGVQGNSPFYIGSEELFSKNLTELITGSLIWEGKPDLNIHYPEFEKKVGNIEGNGIKAKSYKLIDTNWANPQLSEFDVFGVSWNLISGALLPSKALKEVSFFIQGTTENGYIKVTPDKDFFYQDISNFYNYQASALAQFANPPNNPDPNILKSNKIKSDVVYRKRADNLLLFGSEILVNNTITIDVLNQNWEVVVFKPIHIPTLSSFSLNYKANAIDISIIRFHPFEDSFDKMEGTDPTHFDIEAVTDTKNRTAKLVTLIPNTAIHNVDSSAANVIYDTLVGNLYIALKDALPTSKHALLFQFAEYTGNPDLDFPKVKWFYLKEQNTWQELTKGIDYFDDTEGFAQSGIIDVILPKDASLAHTILPKEVHWLRASVTENAAAFDRLLAVHAQAAKVTFTPSVENDLERLFEPLPEKSIKKPVIENGGIAKIEQFYPTYEGRIAEKGDAFYRRVSERLRHKGRAVTLWDYESLVLEAFPQIYKVKCLNHTEILRGGDYDFEMMPSKLAVVVIPDVQKLPQAQKNTPKANQNLLGDIKRFLETRVSPFVVFDVLNPRYEPVGVDFKVKFYPDFDVNFYKKQLQDDLKQHLSPWTKAEPAEIQFGGEIYFSNVLKFVEEQPYVDFVTDFILKENNGKGDRRVVAKTARSVLSSGVISIGDVNC
jgi:hypothetical protein